jgi:hypothetical protein
MEKTTAFDLNQALNCWRSALLSTDVLQHEDLAELEGHMRDAMDDLIGRGLTPEESFLVASRRLGSAPGIAHEYAKVRSWPIWRFRIVWMLLGILGYLELSGLIGLGSSLTFMGGYRFGAESTFVLVLGRLVGLALVVLAIWLVKWLVSERREGCRRLATQLVAHPVWTTAAVVCLLAFAQGISLLWNLWLVRVVSPWEMGKIMQANAFINAINASLFCLMLPIVLIAFARRHLEMTSQ